MARDLAIDIDMHLKSDNNYLRKKAALAAIRIFKKVPDLVEDFQDQIKALLKSKNHGVLLSGVQLVIDIIDIDPSTLDLFKNMANSLVRLLRNLLSLGHLAEYDVSGITNPFLQVKILQLMRRLGHSNEAASENMNDVLAQVATNTETAKNAGNAILYECVQTIMSIESESGLRVLAINILGRFLLNRDNNIRYVALNTLSKVVTDDISAVQRHRNTIVECLKDPDASIRHRALELIYALVNETNIRSLARELLNYLVVAPVELKPELTSRIAQTVEKYAPTARWHIDTFITMLSIAGSNLPDESLSSSLILLIQAHSELHPYVVHKFFWALTEDLAQTALVHVAVWCFGEYGMELMSNPPEDEDTLDGKTRVEEDKIVDLLKKILNNSNDVTKAYVLNAMVKLTTRIESQEQKDRLLKYIGFYKRSMILDLQQRSCEYIHLMDTSVQSQVLAKMPVPNLTKLHSSQTPFSDDEEEDEDEQRSKPQAAAPVATNLLDLDDIFGGGGSTAPAPSAPGPGTASVDLLSDIFASSSTTPAPVQQQSDDLLMMMDSSSPVPAARPSIKAYEKNGLLITLELSKPNPSDPSISHILATFSSTSSNELNNFIFQAAFPKFIKLQMDPLSGNTISSTESATQLVKIQNSMHGTKQLMMRMKLQYTTSGQTVNEIAVVDTFPKDF